MLVRDLLVLLIKTFGLASGLIMLFSNVPLSLFVNFSDEDFYYQFYVVCSLLVSFGVVYFAVFHADKLVKVLRLEKGFENNRIDFGKIDIHGAAWIAVMMVGLLLLVNNLCEMLLAAQQYFSDQMNEIEDVTNAGRNLVLLLLKCTCGYLMVTNARSLVQLVLPLPSKTDDTIDTSVD